MDDDAASTLLLYPTLSMRTINSLPLHPLRSELHHMITSMDCSAHYQTQADFLTHTGVIPQEWAPLLPSPLPRIPSPHDSSNAARYAQILPYARRPIRLPPATPTGVDYGYNIDNKVCFIYISSFSRSLINLESPSPRQVIPE